jgi:hypothetical protein
VTTQLITAGVSEFTAGQLAITLDRRVYRISDLAAGMEVVELQCMQNTVVTSTVTFGEMTVQSAARFRRTS